MSQLYSNAVDTTLAAALSDVATTATLTDGSGLNAPTGSDYELLVLEALGSIEIVRITARTGNTITITRAQEGTTAQSWPSGARAFSGVTADTLAAYLANQTTQTNSLLLGNGAATANTSALGIGYLAEANGNEATAVGGRSAEANAAKATAVGSYCLVEAAEGTALGNSASVYSTAPAGIAIGGLSQVHGFGGIAIGASSDATGDESISIGFGSEANGVGSVAIGEYADANRDRVLAISALPAATRFPEAVAYWWENVTLHSVITTAALNLKNLQTYEIPLPTGVLFFPDEVGIVITTASTVTVQPTVQFGINASAEEHLDAVATTGLAAVGDRQRFQTLKTAKGAATLRFEVTVAATATTLTGRVYWRGFAVETA